MLPWDQTLGALMFAGMIAFLFFGFPVAFSLIFTGLVFGLIGFGLPFFNLLPLRIWGTMTNFTLLAVPLFVFMGVALEKSGLAEELLDTMALLFGRLRGGIAVSVVVVGAILAASTGIVGASVITMGLVSLPTMLRRRYDKRLVTGTICASGTLGQIIPPSIILVLLGDIMGVSVGDLYIGAFIPGFILVALYIVYIVVLAHWKPHLAPPIPGEEIAAFQAQALRRVAVALAPAFVLIVAVLGSIFWGIASPTEGAAVGGEEAHVEDADGGNVDHVKLRVGLDLGHEVGGDGGDDVHLHAGLGAAGIGQRRPDLRGARHGFVGDSARESGPRTEGPGSRRTSWSSGA